MMKKSVAELEAEMLESLERRQLKEIPPITTEKAEAMQGLRSLVSVTDEVSVVEPVAIRTHWATEGDDEELNDLVVWRAANPEIGTHDSGTAMDFVVGKLAEEKRADGLKKMARLMKQEIGEAELKTRVKKVHFMGYDKHGSKGEGVYCSCGMFKLHKRGKVLAAWADKHYEKYGHFWKRS